MHGGKREGAGRKPSELSKTMRVPISLVPEFEAKIALHRKGLNSETEIKQGSESVSLNSGTEIKQGPSTPSIDEKGIEGTFGDWKNAHKDS